MTRRNRQLQSLAQFFHILGDPSRLRIISVLSEGEKNVTGICRALRMSQPAVSQHLRILRMSQLARARRDGKEIYYSMPARTRQALKTLIDRGQKLTS